MVKSAVDKNKTRKGRKLIIHYSRAETVTGAESSVLSSEVTGRLRVHTHSLSLSLALSLSLSVCLSLALLLSVLKGGILNATAIFLVVVAAAPGLFLSSYVTSSSLADGRYTVLDRPMLPSPAVLLPGAAHSHRGSA